MGKTNARDKIVIENLNKKKIRNQRIFNMILLNLKYVLAVKFIT